jgi:hypothetical protein
LLLVDGWVAWSPVLLAEETFRLQLPPAVVGTRKLAAGVSCYRLQVVRRELSFRFLINLSFRVEVKGREREALELTRKVDFVVVYLLAFVLAVSS